MFRLSLPGGLVAGAVVTILLGACGSSSGSSPAATATPAPAALDSCLVGTWTSTGASNGSASSSPSPGVVTYTYSGGDGQVLMVSADGTYKLDDTNVNPILAAGNDASVVRVTSIGGVTGRITTTGNKVAATVDNPATETTTITQNGQLVDTSHGKPLAATYACTAGQSLVIDSGTGRLTYAPAGSGTPAASPT